jgi:hypothetical protein
VDFVSALRGRIWSYYDFWNLYGHCLHASRRSKCHFPSLIGGRKRGFHLPLLAALTRSIALTSFERQGGECLFLKINSRIANKCKKCWTAANQNRRGPTSLQDLQRNAENDYELSRAKLSQFVVPAAVKVPSLPWTL